MNVMEKAMNLPTNTYLSRDSLAANTPLLAHVDNRGETDVGKFTQKDCFIKMVTAAKRKKDTNVRCC